MTAFLYHLGVACLILGRIGACLFVAWCIYSTNSEDARDMEEWLKWPGAVSGRRRSDRW